MNPLDGHPEYDGGEQPSLADFRRLGELARRVESPDAAGGTMDAGGGAFAYTPPPETSLWARLTAAGTGTYAGLYSWKQVQDGGTGAAVDVPGGMVGSFDGSTGPALKEMAGSATLPVGATTGQVVRAWLAESGEFYWFRDAAADASFYARVSDNGSGPVWPAYRSSATSTASGAVTASKPAGTAAEDVLMAAVAVAGSNKAVTPPAGWWEDPVPGVATPPALTLHVFYKVAGSSEPATYTFTPPGSENTAAWVGAFQGAVLPDVLDANAAASGTDLTGFPPVDGNGFAGAVGNARLLVAVFAGLAGARPTPVGVLTDRGGAATGTAAVSVATAEPGIQYGPYSATQPSSAGWFALTVALAPAPVRHAWGEVTQDAAGVWSVPPGGRSGTASAGWLQSLSGGTLLRGTVCLTRPGAGGSYVGVPVYESGVVRVDAADLFAGSLAEKLQPGTNTALTVTQNGDGGEYLLLKAFDTWQQGAAGTVHSSITKVQVTTAAGLTVSSAAGVLTLSQSAASAGGVGYVNASAQVLGAGDKEVNALCLGSTLATTDPTFRDNAGTVEVKTRDGASWVPLTANIVNAQTRFDQGFNAGLSPGVVVARFTVNGGVVTGSLAAKPTVSGSRGGNAALASLLTALAGSALNLITDSTTA